MEHRQRLLRKMTLCRAIGQTDNCVYFFFQAEDGIRDGRVTGVQTCALPISRELALGMAYEDTVRVAELKIRPSRFERVRAEVQAEDGQIIEIAEFFSPRVQEIADTLPAEIGRASCRERVEISVVAG